MRCTNVRSFIDTNVLVYAVDPSEPAKQRKAQALLGGLDSADVRLSAQVLAEFYVVVTRKLDNPMPEKQALETVQELARLRPIAIDASLVSEAATLSLRRKISLWDAMVVRAAVEAECDRILSEDLSDDAVVEGLRIENPFRDMD